LPKQTGFIAHVNKNVFNRYVTPQVSYKMDRISRNHVYI